MYIYKSRWILTSNMFANCFFKKRILPCCDVMDFSFNISETKHVIENLKANVIVTLNVLVDKLK